MRDAATGRAGTTAAGAATGAGGAAEPADSTGAEAGSGSTTPPAPVREPLRATGSGAGTTARAGRNRAGSTYPFGSVATRMPRWTCGAAVTASSLSPTVPTTAPSATPAPRTTATDASWRSVTARPSEVWIVRARPPPGTEPLNVTVPDAGARTSAPVAAAMSRPRCWPAAYSSSASENGRRTGPSAGHTQPAAAGTTTRDAVATTTASESTRRMRYRLRDVEGNCVPR